MNEVEDYVGDPVLDQLIPDIPNLDEEEERIERSERDSEPPSVDKLGRDQTYKTKRKAEPWHIAPAGVECYDKVRDTMEQYGFPRGSDTFAPAGSKKQDSMRMRASVTYVKPISTGIRKPSY